jgi:simple sugar transport system ATP-binding protein
VELRVPIIEARGISKRFGAVQALNKVDFCVYPQEIVGLIGDNGAGKSTLIKILSGIFPPDEGVIYYCGQEVRINSPRDSHRLGIETIYQDAALVDTMSIMRNIFLGREETNSGGFLKKKEMREKSLKILEHSIGVSGIVSPEQVVRNLSGGQKQAVAIARAVHFRKKVLLLDEPTSALSVKETQKVLEYMLRLRDEGVSCVFVTHNLYHVYQVADRFVILSRGRKIKDVAKDETSLEELTCILCEK